MKEESGKNECVTKKSRLFATNNLTNLQFCELLKSRHDLLLENQAKYKEIASLKPEFSFQLYMIKEQQTINKAFCKELLTRQIQRLEDDRSKLSLELTKIRIEDEQKCFDKQNMISKEVNNFKLLKDIWKKDENKKYQGAQEYVEELNRIIGHVKGNIHSLIKFQSNNDKDFEETYIKTFKHLHQKNKQCQKCQEHLIKIDMLEQKIQQMSQKFGKKMNQNIGYLQEISSKDDKLKRLTKNIIKQQTDLKDKIIQLQQELLHRDQTIKQSRKELASITQYKFTNQEQNYDLFIKTSEADLSKFNKFINVNLCSLINFITQEISTTNCFDKKITQSLNQIPSVHPPLAKLFGNDYHISEISQITVNCNFFNGFHSQSRIENVEKNRIDHRKNSLNEQLKSKIEQIEGSNKKYVRTSNNRTLRTISSQNDQNDLKISAFHIGMSPAVKQ